MNIESYKKIRVLCLEVKFRSLSRIIERNRKPNEL